MPEPPTLPPIADAPLSLVLLAHNPGPTLPDILADWRKVLLKRKHPFEIILVDDGSTDETQTRVAEILPSLPEVKLLRHETQLGFGKALRTGLAAAGHPLLCYCPADRQYDPADLAKMLEGIDQVDVVAGYRTGAIPPQWRRVTGLVVRIVARAALGISMEPSPAWRGWSGSMRRWFIRWVFGVFVFDPECAFRLCRRKIFDRLPIQSAGSFANFEIIAKANFLGGCIGQVQVRYRPPDADKTGEVIGVEKPSWRDIHRVLANPKFGPTEPRVEDKGLKIEN